MQIPTHSHQAMVGFECLLTTDTRPRGVFFVYPVYFMADQLSVHYISPPGAYKVFDGIRKINCTPSVANPHPIPARFPGGGGWGFLLIGAYYSAAKCAYSTVILRIYRGFITDYATWPQTTERGTPSQPCIISRNDIERKLTLSAARAVESTAVFT